MTFFYTETYFLCRVLALIPQNRPQMLGLCQIAAYGKRKNEVAQVVFTPLFQLKRVVSLEKQRILNKNLIDKGFLRLDNRGDIDIQAINRFCARSLQAY